MTMRLSPEELDLLLAKGNCKVASSSLSTLRRIQRDPSDPLSSATTQEPTPVAVATQTKKGQRQLEHAAQVMLFQRVRKRRAVDPRYWMVYATPNASATAARAKYFASEGVESGIPDISIMVAREPFHAGFLELKITSSNDLSEHQEEYRVRLIEGGYWYRAVYGLDEADLAEQAWATLCEYLGAPLSLG